jgi:hypothetical protein
MPRRIEVPENVRQRLAQWYSDEFLRNTTVLRGSFFGTLLGWFGQHAVTINKTVHFTPRAPDMESNSGTILLGHECFHIVQQTEMGWWMFLIRYAIRWRPSHVRRGWEHPMERPAYDRGKEIRRALGG